MLHKFQHNLGAVLIHKHKNLMPYSQIYRDKSFYYLQLEMKAPDAAICSLSDYTETQLKPDLILKITHSLVGAFTYCAEQNLKIDFTPSQVYLIGDEVYLCPYAHPTGQFSQHRPPTGDHLSKQLTWALGVLIYQLLTQKLPFKSAREHSLAMFPMPQKQTRLKPVFFLFELMQCCLLLQRPQIEKIVGLMPRREDTLEKLRACKLYKKLQIPNFGLGPFKFQLGKDDCEYRCLDKNGYYYEGQCRSQLPHGAGILVTHELNLVQEGSFVCGLLQGHARITTPTEVHEGSYMDSKRHGPGILYSQK